MLDHSDLGSLVYLVWPPSVGIQKRDQIHLLFWGEIHLESLIIEIDQLPQVCGCAIVKIGSAGCEAPQDGAFQAIHVAALSRDQGFSRVRCIKRIPYGWI